MEENNRIANREIACNTSAYQDGPAVRTNLTLDFSGVTKDDLVEYAIDSLVIKWQASARRAANKKENAIPIPKTATYLVPKPGVRVAVTLTPLQMLEQLFGKEKVLSLVNAAGGDIDAVVKKFKEMIG